MTPKLVLAWTGVSLVIVVALSIAITLAYSIGVAVTGGC